MTEAEHYRKQAEHCERMARSTSNEDDQRAWLELAQAWLGLLSGRHGPPARDNGRPPPERDTFEAHIREAGTGQPRSKASH